MMRETLTRRTKKKRQRGARKRSRVFSATWEDYSGRNNIPIVRLFTGVFEGCRCLFNGYVSELQKHVLIKIWFER